MCVAIVEASTVSQKAEVTTLRSLSLGRHCAQVKLIMLGAAAPGSVGVRLGLLLVSLGPLSPDTRDEGEGRATHKHVPLIRVRRGVSRLSQL